MTLESCKVGKKSVGRFEGCKIKRLTGNSYLLSAHQAHRLKEFRSGELADFVLPQLEMEKRRSPLVSIPPFGRGFSRHGVFRSDGVWAAQERMLTPPVHRLDEPTGISLGMVASPQCPLPFRPANHCNSATSCRFSTSGLPVTPPEP